MSCIQRVWCYTHEDPSESLPGEVELVLNSEGVSLSDHENEILQWPWSQVNLGNDGANFCRVWSADFGDDSFCFEMEVDLDILEACQQARGSTQQEHCDSIRSLAAISCHDDSTTHDLAHRDGHEEHNNGRNGFVVDVDVQSEYEGENEHDQSQYYQEGEAHELENSRQGSGSEEHWDSEHDGHAEEGGDALRADDSFTRTITSVDLQPPMDGAASGDAYASTTASTAATTASTAGIDVLFNSERKPSQFNFSNPLANPTHRNSLRLGDFNDGRTQQKSKLQARGNEAISERKEGIETGLGTKNKNKSKTARRMSTDSKGATKLQQERYVNKDYKDGRKHAERERVKVRNGKRRGGGTDDAKRDQETSGGGGRRGSGADRHGVSIPSSRGRTIVEFT